MKILIIFFLLASFLLINQVVTNNAYSQDSTSTSQSDSVKKEIENISDSLIITGVIVDTLGNPRVDEEIWLFVGIKGAMIVGNKGRVINPISVTKKGGNFKLVADRSFILKHKEFTIGIKIKPLFQIITEYPLLKDEKNIPIVFKFDPKAKSVDLGKIIFK